MNDALKWGSLAATLVLLTIGFISLDSAVGLAPGWVCVENCSSSDLQIGALWGSVEEGRQVTSPDLLWVARLAIAGGLLAGLVHRFVVPRLVAARG